MFKTNKPIIGMLHLVYLEGEHFKGIDYVVQKALKDVDALQTGGIDGILIENWKEFSVGEFVSSETAKNLHRVVVELKKFIKVPFGINVLNNDYKVAFSVAKSAGASFIELDVFVDKVRSDFQNNKAAIVTPFVINPKPFKIWKYAKGIDAEKIPLFCFVQPKHYIMLEKGKTIEDSTIQAIKEGASAVLVTKAIGFAPTVDLVKRAKSVARGLPIGMGSGFNAENAKEILPFVDFAIVGTSIKTEQETNNLVDQAKVKNLMKLVKEFRNSI